MDEHVPRRSPRDKEEVAGEEEEERSTIECFRDHDDEGVKKALILLVRMVSMMRLKAMTLALLENAEESELPVSGDTG